MQTGRARESKKMEPRCVECGFPIKTLFVQYSPGNIRLMRCENCKAVADEYIECEFMIISIDLILHKTKAYRHLLFNVINQHTVNFEGSLWKSIFAFLLLDAYRSLLLKRNEGEWGSSMSFSSNCLDIPRDYRGCLCRKLCVSLYFTTFNEAGAKLNNSDLQVQRHFACRPSFKLLQDFSYCHNGLGISIFCNLHH
ncbi:hypothetical protein OIU77_010550 [Salix suchowensis]|uniref:Protein ARV n=1 Tax=Salix suchowensis TaxID=1278906 RepID=A0ABQ9A9Q9_9ROSI|nr:hypothetical protein OIU77_010550 [Salix suchowensis]KAJ6328893.1 hypothetical protein OIU77_010550 [Salix suchowensis]